MGLYFHDNRSIKNAGTIIRKMIVPAFMITDIKIRYLF